MQIPKMRGAPSRLAQGLGWAGLLPFVALAAALWLASEPERRLLGSALIAYGALIASFLGGMHWGLAMQHEDRPRLLVWGVLPSLLAWPWVVWPGRSALLALALVLWLCLWVDRRLYTDQGLEAWLPLRWRLTIVASLCCLAGAWALPA